MGRCVIRQRGDVLRPRKNPDKPKEPEDNRHHPQEDNHLQQAPENENQNRAPMGRFVIQQQVDVLHPRKNPDKPKEPEDNRHHPQEDNHPQQAPENKNNRVPMDSNQAKKPEDVLKCVLLDHIETQTPDDVANNRETCHMAQPSPFPFDPNAPYSVFNRDGNPNPNYDPYAIDYYHYDGSVFESPYYIFNRLLEYVVFLRLIGFLIGFLFVIFLFLGFLRLVFTPNATAPSPSNT
jgi:hypothetical protein